VGRLEEARDLFVQTQANLAVDALFTALLQPKRQRAPYLLDAEESGRAVIAARTSAAGADDASVMRATLNLSAVLRERGGDTRVAEAATLVTHVIRRLDAQLGEQASTLRGGARYHLGVTLAQLWWFQR